MKTTLQELLSDAQSKKYAVGAFNIYNLEGIKAVISAAEIEESPVILQIHPNVLLFGGRALIQACLSAVEDSTINALVHLDHATSKDDLYFALKQNIESVMVDGSHLSFKENIALTSGIAQHAHQQGAFVEAELGRLSGNEDGLSVPDYEAKLTKPSEAKEFVEKTKIDALAVSIGNVHGHYAGEPNLDFDRLKRIRDSVNIPLVLHGASGLTDQLISNSIDIGIVKINVNTELREAYLHNLERIINSKADYDLLNLMEGGVVEMRKVVISKIRLFKSNGKST